MDRIIAVGDSNTFGHHLEAFDYPKTTPSLYAWPSILGSLTNLEVVNLSFPGNGFKSIWHTINTFNFKPNDHLIILYPPDHYRVDILQENNINRLRWYEKNLESKVLFKYIFDKHDQIIEDYLIIDHIQYIFSTKVKSIIQMLFSLKENDWPITQNIRKIYPNLANGKFANFDMWSLFELYPKDRAFDNEHPGKIIQQEFAKQIYNNYFK